jgi:hypothetical protein
MSCSEEYLTREVFLISDDAGVMYDVAAICGVGKTSQGKGGDLDKVQGWVR